MKNEKEPLICDDIKVHVDRIAEKLWSNHASLFVGAGFSKNSSKDFADWNQLADKFFEKARDRKPDAEERRYLSVLKLAEEVEVAHERQALDQILKENIPDETSKPSRLHYMALKLPWIDVLTTNYDTLLEKTCTEKSRYPQYYIPRYDIVRKMGEMVNSTRPRIIKLHGSFPSNDPFIITEDDYRKYPKQSAVFVNTVQQSLIENSLCLIGFSGDDPNFLKWVGWINDNLDREKAPPIYMIGILNLSESQRKFLERRNITLVDFARCKGFTDKDHYRALYTFFDYLSDKGNEYSQIDWPNNPDFPYKAPKGYKCDQNEIAEIIKIWKKARVNYPEWLILPVSQREALWTSTSPWLWYINSLNGLEAPYDLNFCYEFNWRLHKCLLLPFSNHVKFYEELLSKYWPFDKHKSDKVVYWIKNTKYKDFNWKEIRKMWNSLSISLLKYYRVSGEFEKYDKLFDKLKNVFNCLDEETQIIITYEDVVSSLYKLEIKKFMEKLSVYFPNFTFPFVDAKIAGLFAETGNADKAEEIINQSLREIRAKLNLKPISNNYSLVSQEAYLMQLQKYIKDGTRYDESKQQASKSEKEDIKEIFFQKYITDRNEYEQKFQLSSVNDMWIDFEKNKDNVYKLEWEDLLKEARKRKNKNYRESLEERWNDLRKYKCDPSAELRYFESQVRWISPVSEKNTLKRGFDIGKITETSQQKSVHEDMLIAYKFLCYVEEIGLPFHVNSFTFSLYSVDQAINIVSDSAPWLALVSLIRNGKSQSVDYIFNRKSLTKLSVEFNDSIISQLIAALEDIEQKISNENPKKHNRYLSNFTRTIPEIISRLCCKCSNEKRELIWNWIIKVYKSPNKFYYWGVDSIIKRILNTYTQNEKIDLIPHLLEVEPLDITNSVRSENFINPFRETNFNKSYDFLKVKIEKENIDKLLSLLDQRLGNRQWVIMTLVELYSLGLLSEDQSTSFGKKLWANVDNNGLPRDTGYFKFAFIDLPYPEEINPKKLVYEYIKRTALPIQGAQKQLKITGGHVPICNEIVGITKFNVWKNNDLIKLLNDLVKWWDTDKDKIKSTEDDNTGLFSDDEIKNRLSNIQYVLRDTIIPEIAFSEAVKDKIQYLENELHGHKIYMLECKAIGVNKYVNDVNELISNIQVALMSTEHNEVVDALRAMYALFKKNELDSSIKVQLDEILGQKILWKHKIAYSQALEVVTGIINKQSEHFSENLFEKCVDLLKSQYGKLNVNSEKDNNSFNEVFEIRTSISKLTSTLYKYLNTEEKDIPDIIFKWGKCFLNEGEFTDIKKYWLPFKEEILEK